MTRPPPRSPLFPHTTLFRSAPRQSAPQGTQALPIGVGGGEAPEAMSDRKSTRLNSSHSSISYVFLFFLNDTAPPEISPLPPHDALPICPAPICPARNAGAANRRWGRGGP